MKGVVVGSGGSGYRAAEDDVVVREVKRRRLVKVLFAVRAWKLVRFGITEETVHNRIRMQILTKRFKNAKKTYIVGNTWKMRIKSLYFSRKSNQK